MAHVVDEGAIQWRHKGNLSLRYPWQQWFDGQIWALRQGEDFTETPRRFRALAYYEADKFGERIRTRIVDGVCYIQAIMDQDS